MANIKERDESLCELLQYDSDDDYVAQQLEEDKFKLISEAKNKATVTNKPDHQKIEFLPTPKKPDFKVETIDKYAKKPNEDKLLETCHAVGSALNSDSLKKRKIQILAPEEERAARYQQTKKKNATAGRLRQITGRANKAINLERYTTTSTENTELKKEIIKLKQEAKQLAIKHKHEVDQLANKLNQQTRLLDDSNKDLARVREHRDKLQKLNVKLNEDVQKGGDIFKLNAGRTFEHVELASSWHAKEEAKRALKIAAEARAETLDKRKPTKA